MLIHSVTKFPARGIGIAITWYLVIFHRLRPLILRILELNDLMTLATVSFLRILNALITFY